MEIDGVDGRILVELYGLPSECWRCHKASLPLVGIRRAIDESESWLVRCSDPVVLQFGVSLLPPGTDGVGEIKVRSSKTAGTDYLSNGCPHCDSLFGDFYLYSEELLEVMATEGLAGLRVLATVSVDEREWQRTIGDRDRPVRLQARSSRQPRRKDKTRY